MDMRNTSEEERDPAGERFLSVDMPERSRPSLEEYVRARVALKARRERASPHGDHRLEAIRALAIDLQRDGMRIDAAIAAAWDLVFPVSLPHPQRGTRWQRRIGRQLPGVPLIFGKPDR